MIHISHTGHSADIATSPVTEDEYEELRCVDNSKFVEELKQAKKEA